MIMATIRTACVYRMWYSYVNHTSTANMPSLGQITSLI